MKSKRGSSEIFVDNSELHESAAKTWQLGVHGLQAQLNHRKSQSQLQAKMCQ